MHSVVMLTGPNTEWRFIHNTYCHTCYSAVRLDIRTSGSLTIQGVAEPVHFRCYGSEIFLLKVAENRRDGSLTIVNTHSYASH